MPILTGSAPKAVRGRGKRAKKVGVPRANRPSPTGRGRSRKSKPSGGSAVANILKKMK